MPEIKNSFQKGKMNKDLDERLVPNGEYRDAKNVQVSTSDDSDVGTLQTIMGNSVLSNIGITGATCVGSISDTGNDKIYWLIAGDSQDVIAEYDYVTDVVMPVCVDNHAFQGRRSLNFNEENLITGLNIIDGMLFWTDNDSEPKRIHIARGKLGSANFNNHTVFMVRDVGATALPNTFIPAVNINGSSMPIQEKHLTVIKKGPSTAPVLEMIDTTIGDWDGDNLVGGGEISSTVSNASGLSFLDADGEFLPNIIISTTNTTDFPPGAFLNIYQEDDRSVKVRVKISGAGGPTSYSVDILSGNKSIEGETNLRVELEQDDSLFEFKFVRFGYRYKYEDGEYSQYSPFTQPAFLPGPFNYLPKEGYNLGMVNRLRKLAIRDFVHTRSMPKDVVSIDILYKESNSPNVYSVKTVKRRTYNPDKWDEWNAVSNSIVVEDGINLGVGWAGRTKGYIPIQTEMIHATLPGNQLLRPWDNVPRKALAQEIVGNRLVYGNYLQNYNLKSITTSDNDIKIDLKAQVRSRALGSKLPEEIEAGPDRLARNFSPSKSLKTLRTYQLGVVYIDKYGRETPVFSEDKRGKTSTGPDVSEASIYNKKDNSHKRNQLIVEMKNDPPDWATHFKLFVKETSNEYYNLAMDRWYDAEDGNIWLSFPSAERNKVDEETFLILKKQHDVSTPVSEQARYKIIAIENEAPRFIKLQNVSQGGITDDGSLLGIATAGFPLEDGFFVFVEKLAFENAGWKESLINQDISQTFMRVKSSSGISIFYRIKQISFVNSGLGYYKIESAKQFGPDMAHTSPDGTFLNRNQTCELQVSKRVPEDKAEFEGRFFVKILKDHTLIEKLGITSTLSLDYVTTMSMQVQYINPRAIQAPGGWNGYNTDPGMISVGERQSDFYAIPSENLSSGDGQKFWEMAGKVDQQQDSFSSGWFIDAVEGYRMWKGSINGETKTMGVRHNPVSTSSLCWASIPHDGANLVNSGLNALGINTYGETSNDYLDAPEPIKAPVDDSNSGIIANADVADGGQVAPSLGIDKNSGIINISYSGLNIDFDNNAGTSVTDWNDLNHAFNSATKHVGDEAFISKLTQPGTIWRWKEDPGQVLYKTVAITGLSNSSTPYTQSQWSRESLDMDGNPGVMLFNYANFTDYAIKPHHRHGMSYRCACDWTPCTLYCVGGNKAGQNKCHHIKDTKVGWVSRAIKGTDPNVLDVDFHCPASCACLVAGAVVWAGVTAMCSPYFHPNVAGANAFANLSNYPEHFRFPNNIWEWDSPANKRRRFAFKAEPLDDPSVLIGDIGPHNYLPTNDCNFDSHFDASATPITTYPTGTPQAGTTFPNPAPGVRPDGMYTGYDEPGGTWQWDDGSGTPISVETIPQYKRWSAAGVPTQTPVPGSFTWEIVESFSPDEEKFSSTNPAIWETEPKEDVGMDIYHETGQIYPIHLNDNTIEQFVGGIHENISRNSYVQCWDGAPPVGNGTGTIPISTTGGTDIRVYAAYDRFVKLASVDGTILDATIPAHTIPSVGSYLMFWRADGGVTEAHVGSATYNSGGTWFELVGKPGEVGVHNKMIHLPWFNCYSFGNGVESDRIRDDYNQVTIDNGPKVSTTIEEPYLEDRRKSGFIWSGIYNSTSGVNNLNQFIQAEKITKDLNPVYGSIQKLHVRDNDLVAFCEDRVLKVLANKDALYNADGNTNIVATNRVLGTAKPFVGDFGISKNPESFASDSYRSYFSDTSRGAVIRLSQDGLTSISNMGMKDWFSDNLPNYGRIIGSFDDNKNEYNMTLTPLPGGANVSLGGSYGQYPIAKTLSFSEPANGWVSFKSFIHENGISLNNSYYTFSNGELWRHHVNEVRNNFYGQQFQSSVDVIFNQAPGMIKSFSALNYEGTQSRITQDTLNNPDYYDNEPKQGWYVDEMVTDVQELGEMEFWDKEDKWFSQIKGVATEWLNDGTAGNIDPREFSYQGIGNAEAILCPTCPPVVSYACDRGRSCREISGSSGYATRAQCEESGCGQPAESWNCTSGTSGRPDVRGSNTGGDTRTRTLRRAAQPSRGSESSGATTMGRETPSRGGCTDPGDGSGRYSSYCECVNASMCCDDAEAYFFTCPGIPLPSPVVNGCMDDGVTTDPWITRNRPGGWIGPASNYLPGAFVDDCSCTYLSVSTWNCDGQGNCYEVFDSSGQWSSDTICQQNCPLPCPPSIDLHPTTTSASTSSVAGDCSNGIYNNDGSATVGLTSDPGNPTNWKVEVFSSGTTPVYSSGTMNGPTSVVIPTLTPGFYTFKVIDIDTGCDWQDSFTILCEDPPVVASWDCVSGDCVDPGTGQGLYSSLSACQAAPGCEPQGCTDPCACNYDANAVIDDGSCYYDCGALPFMETWEMGYTIASNTTCSSDPNCNGAAYTAQSLQSYLPVSTALICGFPNNEFAIQTLIANPNRGVNADMRHVAFYRNNNCTTKRHSLRIRHVDLDQWYQLGPGIYFFTWADYIDAAIATGVISNPLGLKNPAKINVDGWDHTQGYNIKLDNVREKITNAFIAHCANNPSGGACNDGSTTQSRCEDEWGNTADCDRTFSTICQPCTSSTAATPWGTPPCGSTTVTPPPPPPPTPACTEGMDVTFIIDYTSSMGNIIDSIKTNVATVVNTIQTSSGANNYRLALVTADETHNPNPPTTGYAACDSYTNLPAPQRVVNQGIGVEGPARWQIITAWETFSSNNGTAFSSILGELHNGGTQTMTNSSGNTENCLPLGSGWRLPEPTDFAAQLVTSSTTPLVGAFRPNVAKYIVIITDALPGGVRDAFTQEGWDDIEDMITYAIANGIKYFVCGPGVDNQETVDINGTATLIYPWQELANQTGGAVSYTSDATSISNLIIAGCA
jgi:hypothetical protein